MNAHRLRWAIRAVLILGVAASTAANVLHAADNPVSRTIAAWPPLALLVTVEVVSRVPVHRRALAVARLLATVVIAGIAAWVSYWHMAGVAARYGETGASPYLLPLSVDGLIVVASICLVELSGPTLDKRLVSAPVQGVDNTTEGTAQPIDPQLAPADSPAAVSTRTPSRAERVVRAHRQWPDASNPELARRAGVSTKTVQRHRPKSTPGQVNGRTTELTTTKGRP